MSMLVYTMYTYQFYRKKTATNNLNGDLKEISKLVFCLKMFCFLILQNNLKRLFLAERSTRLVNLKYCSTMS